MNRLVLVLLLLVILDGAVLGLVEVDDQTRDEAVRGATGGANGHDLFPHGGERHGPQGRSWSERGGSRALDDEFSGTGIDGDSRVAAVFLIGFFLAVVLSALRINSQALSDGVSSGHSSGGQGRGGGEDVDLGCDHLVIGPVTHVKMRALPASLTHLWMRA